MSRLDPYLSKGMKKSRVAKGEVVFSEGKIQERYFNIILLR